MKIPIVDFSVYDDNDAYSLRYLADQIDAVLADIGFMSVTNLGLDWALVDDIFGQSRRFFASPIDSKKRSAYRSAAENFGYQGVCEENLDPSQPADIKESFIMRNIIKMAVAADRWPDDELRACAVRFFSESLRAAHRMQRVLAIALDQEREFFVSCHSGQNITLRLLHYPKWEQQQVVHGQLGAGAHTDYGLLTLLFQDAVGGLEVMTKQGDWVSVDYVPQAIVVNCGDLLELWTNGRYRSTPHRVQPKTGGQARFSMAMFVDPDSDTVVDVLDSCITADKPAMFPPLTAGEHILRKIQATQLNTVYGADTSAGRMA
jgi:isopenicillin N synthase-like dioxygenase